MPRRDDGKTRALAASRTLNPRPEKMTDPAFAPGSFFDPADLVLVKSGHKPTEEAVDLPEELLAGDAALRPAGLAAALLQRTDKAFPRTFFPVPRIYRGSDGSAGRTAIEGCLVGGCFGQRTTS